MTLTEYFDPDNLEHCQAYREMRNTGVWPEWFLKSLSVASVQSENFYLEVAQIQAKIADFWVQRKLVAGKHTIEGLGIDK